MLVNLSTFFAFDAEHQFKMMLLHDQHHFHDQENTPSNDFSIFKCTFTFMCNTIRDNAANTRNWPAIDSLCW